MITEQKKSPETPIFIVRKWPWPSYWLWLGPVIDFENPQTWPSYDFLNRRRNRKEFPQREANLAVFHRKGIATAIVSLPQRNRNLFPRKNRCVQFDRIGESQTSTANHRRETVHLGLEVVRTVVWKLLEIAPSFQKVCETCANKTQALFSVHILLHRMLKIDEGKCTSRPKKHDQCWSFSFPSFSEFASKWAKKCSFRLSKMQEGRQN